MSKETAVVRQHPNANLPALAIPEAELIGVLRNSLYPGANDDSIKLVIGYCKASGLDPMQKPVHLVPMNVKDAKTGEYAWRDVIMPGIGLYRTQAARSGEYAGVSEPEFGSDVTEKLGGVDVTFPAWCKVIVKRLLPDGQIAEFAATERWKENYATAKKDTAAPNAMWKKRPYAQLAKCAEAQALRKAFPEFGAAPTAEEMEGKEIDMGTITDRDTGEVKKREETALPPCPDDKFQSFMEKGGARVQAGESTAAEFIAWLAAKYTLTDDQIQAIRDLEQKPPIDSSFVEEMNAAEGAQQ